MPRFSHFIGLLIGLVVMIVSIYYGNNLLAPFFNLPKIQWGNAILIASLSAFVGTALAGASLPTPPTSSKGKKSL